MMVALKRIQQGLNIASSSFLTIWEHKTLLLYLLIPVALNFIFPVYSAYNFIYTLISRGAPTDFFIVLKAMSKAIIADLGIACISIHTFMLLERQAPSMRDVLSAITPRIPILASWSLITGTVIYLALSMLDVVSRAFENMPWIAYGITGIQIMLGIIWILTVFFMIQILALENLSLIHSLKRSYTLARSLILQIIGGEFWIGLICLLSTLPLMILFEKPMAYYLFENQAIHDWSGIVPSILILIGWICATAQTVFRTKLYYLFYVQPRDQEVDVFFYPRF